MKDKYSEDANITTKRRLLSFVERLKVAILGEPPVIQRRALRVLVFDDATDEVYQYVRIDADKHDPTVSSAQSAYDLVENIRELGWSVEDIQ